MQLFQNFSATKTCPSYDIISDRENNPKLKTCLVFEQFSSHPGQIFTKIFFKAGFTQYPFFVRFCLLFLLYKKTYVLFHPHFYMPISALTILSQAEPEAPAEILQGGEAKYPLSTG